MRKIKSDSELKREYWAEHAYTDWERDRILQAYPDKPATTGEAVFILQQRILDLLSKLPIVGRYIR